MSATFAYPHLVKEDGHPARLERHPRTRVAMIAMDYLARGLSAEEIVGHYPYLTAAEVHSAMAYYHDPKDEVDAEIEAELETLKNHAVEDLSSTIRQKLKSNGVA